MGNLCSKSQDDAGNMERSKLNEVKQQEANRASPSSPAIKAEQNRAVSMSDNTAEDAQQQQQQQQHKHPAQLDTPKSVDAPPSARIASGETQPDTEAAGWQPRGANPVDTEPVPSTQGARPSYPPEKLEQSAVAIPEKTQHQPAVCPIQYPAAASKLRTDCKLKDAYKIGKTLGTGGELK